MSDHDQLTLQPHSVCPFCASQVSGNLTRWRCAEGHGSEVTPDGMTVVLVDTSREAEMLSDFEVQVSYPCGHTSAFRRADDQPMTASDMGELMQTSCTCQESP
jgi:hypothetical protein